MPIEEKARSIVELDGKQAKDELGELRDLAKQYRKELREMTEKNDLKGVQDLEKKLKDVNVQMAAARKTTFDYNQVLKNLSGATIKEMEKAQTALTKEIKNTTRGTDEYIKKTKQLSQVRAEISKTRGDMNQYTTTQSRLNGVLTKAVGLIGGFYGAVKIGQTIIEASEKASDKWAQTIGELSSMWDYFIKSVSTADFKNFWEGMSKAAAAGREYAKQLDEIEDRNRAISMREAEINLEIEKQEKIYKDELKPMAERIAAIDKILQLEEEVLRVRKSIDKQAWDAKVKELAKYGITEEILMANMKNYELNKQMISQAEEYARKLKEIQNAKYSVSTPYGTQEYSISDEEKARRVLELNSKTSDDVIQFAEIRSKYNKLNAEELDQLVTLYLNLYRAETQYYQNTSRASARRSALVKEVNGNKTEEKYGAESPYYGIQKFQSDEIEDAYDKFGIEAAEKMLDDFNEYSKDLIKDTISESEMMQLENFQKASQSELDIYYETLEGKKALLKKQLDQGVIFNKEYNARIKELEITSLAERAELYGTYFGQLSGVFKKNTAAYKIAVIAEATANTIAGGVRALKDYAFPYNLLVMAAVLAQGYAQVSKLKGINTGYASGGWTGPGGKYQPAGIVHADEYVINKRQMHDPKIRSLVTGVIEPDRVAHLNTDRSITAVTNVRGYASGGPVTAPTAAPNVNVEFNEANALLIAIASQMQRMNNNFETGKLKAVYDDREVEKISVRQGTISKIKRSVSRG